MSGPGAVVAAPALPNPGERIEMADRTCSVDGCENPHIARGWCDTHYRRWRKHGDPLIVRRILGDDLARFRSYIEEGPEGCWLWTGALNTDGYGCFRYEEVARGAHRVAYATFVGPIPEGLELDHLCGVRRCCNPLHLEPVTRTENIRRAVKVREANRRAAA